MSSANDKIHVYEHVRVYCLGCRVDMPYRSVDETVSGVTVEIPLRYCGFCQENAVAELSAQRKAKGFMSKFDGMIASLRGELRGGK